MVGTPMLLSGSTDGRPQKIAATASPGDTVHTVGAGVAGFDEVFLWASNSSASAVTVTVQWGGTTAPDDSVAPTVSLPANSGPTNIVAGLRLRNGLLVKVFAGTTNVVMISGYANRYV